MFGATSLVGECLLPLLSQAGWNVRVFSRQLFHGKTVNKEWQKTLPDPNFVVMGEALNKKDTSLTEEQEKGDIELSQKENKIECWICVAPIWVLPEYFDLLKSSGARRIVALSSTSRFTKQGSSDHHEKMVAQRLIGSEACLRAWAEENGVECVILRPTLIYGRGRDKNISEIARFIHRFNFFPLVGRASGLRQPVHAEDVAAACLAAMNAEKVLCGAYNLSGGEILRYRDMVMKIFAAMGRRPLLFSIPLWMFRVAVKCLRILPRYRHWSIAMAERMNRDLVFDHAEAARDLGFHPRPFRLEAEDVPF